MERARLCNRPGCVEPAAASLIFQYATRTVWLQELGERDPHTIELCSMHANRLSPPRGWIGEDQRRSTDPPALAAS